MPFTLATFYEIITLVTVTRDASSGGRVICETKRIWSHYLLLDREESLPNLAPSLRKGAGPLQPIDATAPWRGFVEQITLRDWPAALTIAEAGS